MTAEKGIEFIQNNGCPECQSLDIYYNLMEVEGVNAVQEACCQGCGHEWHDVYSYRHSVHDRTSRSTEAKEVMRVADI